MPYHILSFAYPDSCRKGSAYARLPHIADDDNIQNESKNRTHFYFSELQLSLLANNPRTDQVISLQSRSPLAPCGPSNVCPVKL